MKLSTEQSHRWLWASNRRAPWGEMLYPVVQHELLCQNMSCMLSTVVRAVAVPIWGSTFTHCTVRGSSAGVPTTSSKYWVGRKSSSRMRMGSSSSTLLPQQIVAGIAPLFPGRQRSAAKPDPVLIIRQGLQPLGQPLKTVHCAEKFEGDASGREHRLDTTAPLDGLS